MDHTRSFCHTTDGNGLSGNLDLYCDLFFTGISRKYNPTWQGWIMIDSYKKYYTVGSKEFKSKLDNDVQLQKLVYVGLFGGVIE